MQNKPINGLALSAYDRHYEEETDRGMVIPFRQRDERAAKAHAFAEAMQQLRREEAELELDEREERCLRAARGVANCCAGAVGIMVLMAMCWGDWRSAFVGQILIGIICATKRCLL